MQLTAQQVKEKLHIGDKRLHQLIESGMLPTSNVRRADTKKFFRRFDSAVVNKVAAELKATNGHSRRYLTQPPTPEVDFSELAKQRSWKSVPSDIGKTVVVKEPTEPPTKGIMSRLKSIEEKLDLLIKTWS